MAISKRILNKETAVNIVTPCQGASIEINETARDLIAKGRPIMTFEYNPEIKSGKIDFLREGEPVPEDFR